MECSLIPARVIATSFGLAAFAAAIVVGVAAGNPTSTVLKRAIIIMVLCWLIGRIIGHIAQITVQSHVDKYKEENPIPTDEADQTTASPNPTPSEKTT